MKRWWNPGDRQISDENRQHENGERYKEYFNRHVVNSSSSADGMPSNLTVVRDAHRVDDFVFEIKRKFQVVADD